MNKKVAVNILSLLLSVTAITGAMLALKHSLDLPQAGTMASVGSVNNVSSANDACLALDKAVMDLQTELNALTHGASDDARERLGVALRNKRDMQLSLHCKTY